jgi:2-iminobutanoate/2-iminopropanoate deaminase
MPKTIVRTAGAPEPIGPYSQAVKVGDFLFCSGQIGLDPNTGALASADVEGQTRQVLQNIDAVLLEAGMTSVNVIKTTIFLKSMNDFPKVNAVYGTYFKENPPARSTVEVSRLPKDVLVEIEVTAYSGK